MPNTEPGKPPRSNYLRPNAKRELEFDAQQCKAQLGETSAHGMVTNKAAVARRLKRIEKLLRDDAPPEIPVSERDAVDKRIEDLAVQIQDAGMLSHEEMMRNPPGAVGQNIKWTRQTKDAQLEWKSLQLRQNVDSDDPDIANVERLRPTTPYLSMDRAQIPRRTISTPSAQFTQNYDDIEFQQRVQTMVQEELGRLTENDLATPTGPTSAAAAAAPARMPRKKKVKKGGRTWTPEQKAEASQKWHEREKAKQTAQDAV